MPHHHCSSYKHSIYASSSSLFLQIHADKQIQEVDMEVLEYFYFRIKYFFGMAKEDELDIIVERYYNRMQARQIPCV